MDDAAVDGGLSIISDRSRCADDSHVFVSSTSRICLVLGQNLRSVGGAASLLDDQRLDERVCARLFDTSAASSV